MHAQSVIRRHHVLKNLCQRVDALESWFLSPSDLQGLGIQAGQVGIADNGNRQFRPCFFLPYPDRVLQKYPLDSHDDVRKLNPYPDYATVLRDALASSNVEDPLAFARDNPEEILELSAPDEWVGHAYNIESHVSDHLYACRKSLPKCYSLMGLGSLRGRSIERKKSDPSIQQEPPEHPEWGITGLLDGKETSSPLPHGIILTRAHVSANRADQYLTLHEIRAIVHMMVIRTSHRPFQRYNIHPLLVLSHMSEKHGKIVQASLDGELLVIQYSQLWSFQDEETAPVELFVRYNLSQPVGVERPDACDRALAEALASVNLG